MGQHLTTHHHHFLPYFFWFIICSHPIKLFQILLSYYMQQLLEQKNESYILNTGCIFVSQWTVIISPNWLVFAMKRWCVYCEIETKFVNLRVPKVKLQNTRTEHNLKYKCTNVVQYELPASFWKVRIKITISVGIRLVRRHTNGVG